MVKPYLDSILKEEDDSEIRLSTEERSKGAREKMIHLLEELATLVAYFIGVIVVGFAFGLGMCLAFELMVGMLW
jgi:hypothetical protein